MPPVTIELPIQSRYHEFNRTRWEEILCDPELKKFPGKVETNRHGQILMMPPASGSHSRRQGEILFQLRTLLGGQALPECPISTLNGVRATDVGWYSNERFADVADQAIFETAPEICVEVLSPSNTAGEMDEKKQLYFAAGSEEVWFCAVSGDLSFFRSSDSGAPQQASLICPEFPGKIE